MARAGRQVLGSAVAAAPQDPVPVPRSRPHHAPTRRGVRARSAIDAGSELAAQELLESSLLLRVSNPRVSAHTPTERVAEPTKALNAQCAITDCEAGFVGLFERRHQPDVPESALPWRVYLEAIEHS